MVSYYYIKVDNLEKVMFVYLKKSKWYRICYILKRVFCVLYIEERKKY